MKFSSVFAGASLAGLALSHPVGVSDVEKRQNIDTTILQFALTLEHLENVFYEGALKNFTEADFMAAGYSATYYNNLKYVAHDEQAHVQALTAALQAAGVTPVAACTYSFPYTDVKSFITLSSVLEGVGSSAYLGGAPLITSKYYLTVAGSILATEALHTSYQRAAIGEVPMANPFETPLNPNPVFTLAAAFIVSCPASNPPLPFKAFPSLAATSGSCVSESPSSKKRGAEARWESWAPPSNTYASATATATYASPTATMTVCAAAAGQPYTFTAASAIPDGSYVTFVSGLSIVSVYGTISGKTVTAVVPAIAVSSSES